MYYPSVCQKPSFEVVIIRDRNDALRLHLDLAPMNGSLETLNIHDLNLRLGMGVGETSDRFVVRGIQFQVCVFDGDIVVFERFVYALLQTLVLDNFRLVMCDIALVPNNRLLKTFDIALELDNHRLMPFDVTLELGQRNFLDLAC